MNCIYKNECPSYSGWCEGPRQDFSKCVQFLVTAYEEEKKKAGKSETLESRSVSYFYVIEADRDGVRKLVSRDFPRVFQYTVKISKARRFQTEEKAKEFINGFNDIGKYLIINPVIRKVCRRFSILREGERNE